MRGFLSHPMPWEISHGIPGNPISMDQPGDTAYSILKKESRFA